MVPDITEPTCPGCGRESDSFRSFSAHYAAVHDGPHALVALVGEERLDAMYADGSEDDVADSLGVSQVTVHNALKTIDVSTSNPQHHENPIVRTDTRGYEYVAHKGAKFQHHRLAAVAWFGWDVVVGNVVHHKNTIRWDTREENIELMTQNDHAREHRDDQTRRFV